MYRVMILYMYIWKEIKYNMKYKMTKSNQPKSRKMQQVEKAQLTRVYIISLIDIRHFYLHAHTDIQNKMMMMGTHEWWWGPMNDDDGVVV